MRYIRSACIPAKLPVIWGAACFSEEGGRRSGWLQVGAILYLGVVASDMVTFWLGAALRRGLFTGLKDRLFKCMPPQLCQGHVAPTFSPHPPAQPICHAHEVLCPPFCRLLLRNAAQREGSDRHVQGTA